MVTKVQKYNFMISELNLLNIFAINFMSKLKQKHIEQFLQDMQDFDYGEKDKMQLEQHMTPPELAAKLLFHIYL